MLGAFAWYHFVFLLQGLLWTVILTGIAFGLGIVGGFLVMLLRISRFAPVRWGTAAVIQVVQGIPMMVLFFLAYFGLAFAGVELPSIVSAAGYFAAISSLAPMAAILSPSMAMAAP